MRLPMFAVAGLAVMALSGAALLSSSVLARPARLAAAPMLSTAPDLATYGVRLSPPAAGTSPGVSASRAASIATGAGAAHGPAATVREEVLARLSEVNSDIPQDTLVWAVSIMPPGGLAAYLAPDVHIPGRPYVEPTYTGYYVVYIDATTGARLGADGEGRPVAASSAQSGRGGAH